MISYAIGILFFSLKPPRNISICSLFVVDLYKIHVIKMIMNIPFHWVVQHTVLFIPFQILRYSCYFKR